MTILTLLDLIGTLVFAISGTATGLRKNYDFFGASVIAFVTAIGGGTVRDILIGNTPVSWMTNYTYSAIIIVGIVLTIFFTKWIRKMSRTLFIFDTIGIGVFTILGLERALEFGLNPLIAIMLGMISAVFGGVIRDMLSNEEPLIFHKEIYATACLAGAILYTVLNPMIPDSLIPTILSVLLIIGIRYLAVRFHWKFPNLKMDS